MRRAARIDANHTAIVDALRGIGATVTSLAAVGGGAPDLLIGHRGRNFLIEVKDGDKSASRRCLTDDQVIWHNAWKGQVGIVLSPLDAIRLVTGV